MQVLRDGAFAQGSSEHVYFLRETGARPSAESEEEGAMCDLRKGVCSRRGAKVWLPHLKKEHECGVQTSQ